VFRVIWTPYRQWRTSAGSVPSRSLWSPLYFFDGTRQLIWLCRWQDPLRSTSSSVAQEARQWAVGICAPTSRQTLVWAVRLAGCGSRELQPTRWAVAIGVCVQGSGSADAGRLASPPLFRGCRRRSQPSGLGRSGLVQVSLIEPPGSELWQESRPELANPTVRRRTGEGQGAWAART
jgi:hypothetical protein